MQTLLRASLPHIAQCGFTRAAVVAGTPEVSEMTLSALFPGQDKAETSLPRRLFRFWDETHAPSARAETFDGAVAKLEERLAHSWDVRHHLLPALAMEHFLSRSASLADTVLPHEPWYEPRARLSAAYLAAELHAASGHSESLQHSTDVLRRMASSHPLADTRKLASDTGEWIKWGGRGWLGTFRSLGL